MLHEELLVKWVLRTDLGNAVWWSNVEIHITVRKTLRTTKRKKLVCWFSPESSRLDAEEMLYKKLYNSADVKEYGTHCTKEK